MKINYHHFFSLKPGDVICLTPVPIEDSNNNVVIIEQEIVVTVKSVIFTPNKMIPSRLIIFFEKTMVITLISTVYIESVEINYFDDESKIIAISCFEIQDEKPFIFEYSSITVDK